MRRQHAEISRVVPPGRRNESRKTRKESSRSELDGARAIRPRLLEIEPHVILFDDREAVVNMETLGGFPNLPAMVRGRQSRPASHATGQRWTQDVLAQGEPALLVVGGDLGRAVKIEPGVLPTQVDLGHQCPRLPG